MPAGFDDWFGVAEEVDDRRDPLAVGSADRREPPVESLEIPALYHVARLEEALGNHDAAREYYQRYLDRWGEADLPIPEVREAQDGLAALSRSGMTLIARTLSH